MTFPPPFCSSYSYEAQPRVGALSFFLALHRGRNGMLKQAPRLSEPFSLVVVVVLVLVLGRVFGSALVAYPLSTQPSR